MNDVRALFGLMTLFMFTAVGVSAVVFAGTAGFYAARAMFG